jgi:hypothetical protein
MRAIALMGSRSCEALTRRQVDAPFVGASPPPGNPS